MVDSACLSCKVSSESDSLSSCVSCRYVSKLSFAPLYQQMQELKAVERTATKRRMCRLKANMRPCTRAQLPSVKCYMACTSCWHSGRLYTLTIAARHTSITVGGIGIWFSESGISGQQNTILGFWSQSCSAGLQAQSTGCELVLREQAGADYMREST